MYGTDHKDFSKVRFVVQGNEYVELNRKRKSIKYDGVRDEQVDVPNRKLNEVTN